ncbi:threonine--tRNA ligase, mitochondrial isoform X1 [Bufo gargarizans]|uniref:threonine--tRNA ligase, mitochondrial isoform X1 n=1 Tax=Bufo gargarizans TaxID=30331 RepID=UPI001CF554A3|nr:threonine--tRNA ligase, mitochondrial isoform X1 [Bufo gargarizans]
MLLSMRLLSLLRRRRVLSAHYTDSPEVIPKEPCKTWKPHSTDVGGRTSARDGSGIPESSVLPEFIRHRLQCFETLRERYEARLADKVLRESRPIRISLPEGKVVSGESWRTSLYDVAVQTRSGSAHNVLAARVNGVVFDLSRPLEDDSEIDFLTFDSREGQDVFWHSSAHVLGAALEQIYGGLLCHGPSIENGFFYDIHLENGTVLGSDLPGLEITCKEILRQKLPFQRVEATREELLEMFKYNKFKTQIIEDKVETTTSVYRCGSLVDLCQGPHIRHTGQIKAIKLHKNSTAYWKGDAAQEKLQRVYGISFPDTKHLKEWEKAQEEAASRDHRKIGRDQGLFFFHEMSPGSCFFLPKGAHIYNILTDFIKDEYRKRGFTEVITPNMYNKKLWEQSGHWEHYGKNMFSFPVENETFSLKPMNCPGHCLMFNHRPRSWRELPVRLADFGVLHRNELSGALSGLTRVRRFQQDDAHIFCSMDQLEGEISGCLDFLRAVYTVFGFTFKLFLSTRPEQYMGEAEVWQKAEQELETSLNGFGLPWELNPGDGAFYGPKIDIQIKDAMGRYHQCATIQLDFQLPIRFQLSYVGKDGRTERPVMIHRAVLGSVERMLAVLAENYAGKWPFWLSPFQVMVVPTGASAEDYAQEVCVLSQRPNVVYRMIYDRGFMVDIDTDSGTTFNKKIRRAQLAQYNFILVVGEKEKQNNTVNVRTRDSKQHGEQSLKDLIVRLAELRDTRVMNAEEIF